MRTARPTRPWRRPHPQGTHIVHSMSTPNEEAVERFRRRTQSTDESTLYRNLQAGVYGPQGSNRRAIAERALQLRFTAAADALQVAAGRGASEASDRMVRAGRLSISALWIAIAALGLALLGLATTFGWL